MLMTSWEDEDINMYVIVGLCNPGIKYAGTRHNVGFDVIDLLSEIYGIEVREQKHKALIGKGRIEGQPILLVKPQTFMNLSGESVGDLRDYYKLEAAQDLIVISDDVSLEPGTVRIRRKGSAGGHNGLKNIIAHCHTEEFIRIRIGVGKLPAEGDMIAHVLGRPVPQDRALMELSYDRAAKAVACIVAGQIDQAMNLYNGKVEQAE